MSQLATGEHGGAGCSQGVAVGGDRDSDQIHKWKLPLPYALALTQLLEPISLIAALIMRQEFHPLPQRKILTSSSVASPSRPVP